MINETNQAELVANVKCYTKRHRRPVAAFLCMIMIRISASYPNESRSTDFISDALYDGHKIKLLTLVDNFTLMIGVVYRLG